MKFPPGSPPLIINRQAASKSQLPLQRHPWKYGRWTENAHPRLSVLTERESRTGGGGGSEGRARTQADSARLGHYFLNKNTPRTRLVSIAFCQNTSRLLEATLFIPQASIEPFYMNGRVYAGMSRLLQRCVLPHKILPDRASDRAMSSVVLCAL